MTHPRELWFLNTLAGIEVTGIRTGGAPDVVSQLLPAGYAPPPHVHRASDEWLAVLAGAEELRCGEQLHPAGAGSVVHVPRGTMHQLAVSLEGPARVFVISSPAGYPALVQRLASSPRPSTADPAPRRCPGTFPSRSRNGSLSAWRGPDP